MWKVLKKDSNYAVSDNGQIMSLRKNKILTPKQNWDGYLRIQLWNHGACKYVSLHRLIADAFLPKPDFDNPVINHKNGNKSDNRIENLEWVTQQENIRHAWQTGLARRRLNQTGKPIRQLTKDGQVIREFASSMEVQRTLGIAHTNVLSSIKRNGTAGGYRWEVIER